MRYFEPVHYARCSDSANCADHLEDVHGRHHGHSAEMAWWNVDQLLTSAAHGLQTFDGPRAMWPVTANRGPILTCWVLTRPTLRGPS